MFIIRSLFIVLLLIRTTSVLGEGVQLSEKAQISLITCSPWQGDLYAAFGHSAIRVYDPKWQINHVFNYGVFDFNQPHFYLNFLKGNLQYQLGVSSYSDFIYTYLYRNNGVREQILNLTPDQKQKTLDYLQWNAQPENQYYAYDYFYNNCSTKIRDIFAEVLKKDIRFDSSFLDTGYTIRDLSSRYLTYQPWGSIGIDIGLGLPMDKQASAYEYMYLPEYLEQFFDHTSIVSTHGIEPLITEKRNIVLGLTTEEIPIHIWHPWIVFGMVLLITIGITAYDWRRKKLSSWLDIMLLLATGLVGCLILFLWLGTDHKAAAYNFNLIWGLPTNIVIAFMILFRYKKNLTYYFGTAFLITVVLWLTWSFLPQHLNSFLIPISLSIGIRYGINYWITWQQQKPLIS